MGRKKNKGFQWVRDAPESEVDVRPSRHDQKKEESARKMLVKSMLELSASQWDRLPLSDDLRAALVETQRLQSKGNVRGAMRRQLLRVATVLRTEDVEAISQAMETLPGH